MIALCAVSVLTQHIAYGLNVLPCRAVYDTALVCCMGERADSVRAAVLSCDFKQFSVLFCSASYIFYSEIQIFSVKACYKDLRISKAEASYNVISYYVCSCRCECVYAWSFVKHVYEGANLSIARPEVVSPLGYAVRFVYRYHSYRRFCGELPECRCFKTFRGNVYYPVLALRGEMQYL